MLVWLHVGLCWSGYMWACAGHGKKAWGYMYLTCYHALVIYSFSAKSVPRSVRNQIKPEVRASHQQLVDIYTSLLLFIVPSVHVYPYPTPPHMFMCNCIVHVVVIHVHVHVTCGIAYMLYMYSTSSKVIYVFHHVQY